MASQIIKNALMSLVLTLFLQGCVTAGVHPNTLDDMPLPSLAGMLEQVTPAVVNITTEGRSHLDDSLAKDPFFQRFFGEGPAERKVDGTASGVIIHTQLGHILTNYHVLEGADRIIVTLNDGRQFDATLIGADTKVDLAVITIKADRLTAIRFGDSDRLRVGDFVVAIGNPYGIGQSVTSGIISALHRNPGIGEYENFIQTDASINLGNSGGALINMRGELIGINTAILGGQSGGNIGIGFAIPVNTAAGIIDQIVRYGQVERGLLGIEANNVDAQTARRYNLAINHGALIERVFPNSPAHQAGLEAGDIVLRLNNSEVNGASDIKSIVGSIRVGTTLEIIYLRDNITYRTEAVIGPPLGLDNSRPPIWESN